MKIAHTLMVILACCIAGGSLAAQPAPSHSRPRASKAMWTALQLTETQKAQVKTIHEKYAPAMKLAQKETTDSASVIYGREMADVRELLTFAQQETFDSYMSGARRGRGKRGGMVKVMPVRIGVPR